jgi:hypothetical protein
MLLFNYIMIKQVVLVGILLAAITSMIGLEQQSALAGTKSENRAAGFSDGCHGVPLRMVIHKVIWTAAQEY